jgi:hypothetical protein
LVCPTPSWFKRLDLHHFTYAGLSATKCMLGVYLRSQYDGRYLTTTIPQGLFLCSFICLSSLAQISNQCLHSVSPSVCEQSVDSAWCSFLLTSCKLRHMTLVRITMATTHMCYTMHST